MQVNPLALIIGVYASSILAYYAPVIGLVTALMLEVFSVFQSSLTSSCLGWTPYADLCFTYSRDAVAIALVALVSGVLALLQTKPKQPRKILAMFIAVHASLYMLALSSSAGSAMLSWELLLVSTTLLLALDNRRLALNYFAYMQLGSMLVLVALSGLTMLGPTLVIGALILLGVSVKMGVYPLHLGLANAYDASRPEIAALLSSTAPAGVLLCVNASRYMNIEYPEQAAWLGALAALIVSLHVIGEEDLRRAIVYASLAHSGFVLSALSLNSFKPALLLAAAQAVTEPLAFVGLHIIVQFAKTTRIRRLTLLARSMPVTALAFYIVFTSFAGVPPFPFFLGEILTILSSINTSLHLTLILILASLSATAYALSIWRNVFWHPEIVYARPLPREPSLKSLNPLLVHIALSFIVGILPLFLI